MYYKMSLLPSIKLYLKCHFVTYFHFTLVQRSVTTILSTPVLQYTILQLYKDTHTNI